MYIYMYYEYFVHKSVKTRIKMVHMQGILVYCFEKKDTDRQTDGQRQREID